MQLQLEDTASKQPQPMTPIAEEEDEEVHDLGSLCNAVL